MNTEFPSVVVPVSPVSNALFRPFPFVSRQVPIATNGFDFDEWKRDPAGPVVLRGILADWPLFRDLQQRSGEHARLDYLSERFGENVVRYTRVPASDPFMGYDAGGNQ